VSCEPDGVEFDPPGFNRRLRIGQANKTLFVQALVATLAVEAFDVRVLDRLARSDKAERHTARIDSRIERAPRKLRPIVDHD
jgi:hypothetical protein